MRFASAVPQGKIGGEKAEERGRGGGERRREEGDSVSQIPS